MSYYRRRSFRRYYRPNYNRRFYSPRREVNKYIKNVSGRFTNDGSTVTQVITTFGGTQANESIATGTIQGLRWDIDIANHADGNDVNRIYWAIVIVREGYNPNSLNLANGANLYTPEQDVLAYGVATVTPPLGVSGLAGPAIEHFSDQSRTMRKVQQGDRLMLLFSGQDDTGASVENALGINATIQFFVKG